VGEGADFYKRQYASIGADPQRRVRLETYDEDLGQAGWLEAAEAREFASWLGPGVTSVLDIACGSGGISELFANQVHASMTGVDIDARAIAAARAREVPGCEPGARRERAASLSGRSFRRRVLERLGSPPARPTRRTE
jgi:SAM-dependent methyltransferase